MKVQFSNQPNGAGGKPTGLSVAAVSLRGPYLEGTTANIDSTWPSDRTLAASRQVTFNNSTGYVPGLHAYIGVAFQAQASNEQAVWVTVTTYDQTGPDYSGQCAGNILDGPETAAYHTKYPTQVEAVVGPMLSFSVGPHSGACNGEAQNGTADAARVSLGASDSSVVKKAAQAPNFGSNAGNGFNFYMHSSSSSATKRWRTAGAITSPTFRAPRRHPPHLLGNIRPGSLTGLFPVSKPLETSAVAARSNSHRTLTAIVQVRLESC